MTFFLSHICCEEIRLFSQLVWLWKLITINFRRISTLGRFYLCKSENVSKHENAHARKQTNTQTDRYTHIYTQNTHKQSDKQTQHYGRANDTLGTKPRQTSFSSDQDWNSSRRSTSTICMLMKRKLTGRHGGYMSTVHL